MAHVSVRKLSAVLSADIVGYARLMGTDEAGTLSALKTLRKKLMLPRVRQFKGEIVKSMGDGWLIAFDLVSNAIRCAHVIQRALRRESQIRLRIGVHYDEVVFEDDDIFGDAVNIAARLQQTSDPGGILISEQVLREIDPKLACFFSKKGKRRLRNIDHAITVYRWNQGRPAVRKPRRDAPDIPALVVVPFVDLSSEPDRAHLLRGVMDEIITLLVHLPGMRLFVSEEAVLSIGAPADGFLAKPHEKADFVLSGTVRRDHGQVRVTFQLTDLRSGQIRLADRIDRQPGDILDVQDDVAIRIADRLQANLSLRDPPSPSNPESAPLFRHANVVSFPCKPSTHR